MSKTKEWSRIWNSLLENGYLLVSGTILSSTGCLDHRPAKPKSLRNFRNWSRVPWMGKKLSWLWNNLGNFIFVVQVQRLCLRLRADGKWKDLHHGGQWGWRGGEPGHDPKVDSIETIQHQQFSNEIAGPSGRYLRRSTDWRRRNGNTNCRWKKDREAREKHSRILLYLIGVFPWNLQRGN